MPAGNCSSYYNSNGIDFLDPSYDSSEESVELAFAAHKKGFNTVEVEWSDIVKEAQAYMEDKGGTYSPRLRADSESHWIENDSNTFSFEVTYLRSFALLHSHLAFVSVSKQIFNDTLNFRIENWKTLQSRYATDNRTSQRTAE